VQHVQENFNFDDDVSSLTCQHLMHILTDASVRFNNVRGFTGMPTIRPAAKRKSEQSETNPTFHQRKKLVKMAKLARVGYLFLVQPKRSQYLQQ